MRAINRLLNWTRFIPYACTAVFFLMLTFPGMKNLKHHTESGYLSYLIIGSLVVLFLHFGLVYLFLKYICNKLPEQKHSVMSLVERFNILIGLFIVILFEGLCSDFFSYRQWAYGVIRAETVFEKIDDEWSLKQIEKSKDVSKKMNKSIIDYTESVYLKWQKLPPK